MAITVNIYDSTNNTTKSVSLDIFGEILVDGNAASTTDTYYLKSTTSARDTDNVSLPAKTMTGLDSLALNNAKQSASNTANAYASITALVDDYVYDYLYGHIANQYSSGATEQKRMKTW